MNKDIEKTLEYARAKTGYSLSVVTGDNGISSYWRDKGTVKWSDICSFSKERFKTCKFWLNGAEFPIKVVQWFWNNGTSFTDERCAFFMAL